MGIPAANWESALYFRFGAFGYGDVLLYTANPPEPPIGKIMVTVSGKDQHIILGNSLAQWLTRLNDCGGYEYAYTMSAIEPEANEPTSEHQGLREPLRTEFLKDHIFLNPGDEKAFLYFDDTDED